MKIKLEELSKIVGESLDEYNEKIVEATKEAIDEVMNESLIEVKAKSPVSNKVRKHYRDSWKIKTLYEDKESKRMTVYNTQYQLTHLLEYGHAKLNGGRTKAQPHIVPVRIKANNSILERIKDKL